MLTSVNPQTEPSLKKTIKPLKRLNKNSLFERDDYFIEEGMGFRSGAQNRSGLKLALWSWMSAFIDTLVLISISCFTLVLFSFLMKSPAREMLRFLSGEPNVAKMFLTAFMLSAWSYLIMMRIFMGASLGEWSCQLRLGQPVQRIRTSYALRVAARTTLILLTGIITMPLLSLLLKRDLAGDITGIKIYSLT